jgi:hypothetical protein
MQTAYPIWMILQDIFNLNFAAEVFQINLILLE